MGCSPLRKGLFLQGVIMVPIQNCVLDDPCSIGNSPAPLKKNGVALGKGDPNVHLFTLPKFNIAPEK